MDRYDSEYEMGNPYLPFESNNVLRRAIDAIKHETDRLKRCCFSILSSHCLESKARSRGSLSVVFSSGGHT